MSYLIDTHVLSELRKRDKCHPRVAQWFSALSDDEIFLSVLNIGEIRKGIETIRRRDRKAAAALEKWLKQLVVNYADRILPVDQPVAEEWGRLNVPDPLPVVDALIAATAKVHNLTFATRNVKDASRAGVAYVNPFEPDPGRSQ